MTAPTSADLAANALLSTLSEADRQRLAPQMMVFDLKAGDTLQRAGEEVVDTWFPCASAMAAFCISTNHGANSVEVALIGREGAVGGIVSNGQLPAYATAEVRSAGRFMRIKTAALEQAKLDSITLRHWFSRYSDCLLAQVFQTAACNATHTIAQRTAKWLLAASARTQAAEFELTQDQLAEMLGVGRTFVTKTVRRFRDEGLIATRRGIIAIRNEAALKKTACYCTTAIEEHFDTVLHGIYPVA
jgi:CRP-like cAMP-binding protein